MGSFQQICLGAICLVAAYLFGNYVNNNPPPLSSDVGTVVNGVSQTANGLTASSKSLEAPGTYLPGNIQSRLPISDFSPVENKPAPIVTMKTPLKSRFNVPTVQSAPPEFGAGLAGGSQLPPPSQLAAPSHHSSGGFSGQPFSSSPFSEPVAVTPTIQVPDFSAIAAEFKNTPIELPSMSRLGGMPSHSNTYQPGDQFEHWQNQNPANKPLKQLVRSLPDNDFRNPNQQRLQEEYYTRQPQPKFQAKPETEAAPEFSLQNHDIAPGKGFTQADFDPQLNDDIFGLKRKPDGRYKSRSEPNDQRLQSVSNEPIGGYEYDVPPPVPPGYYDGPDRTSSGFRGNLTFRPELEQRSGVATPNQISEREYAPIDNKRQSKPEVSRNEASSRLPFRLTDRAKTELVQLRDRADAMIGLDSTRFVDHTIGSGETLQSISARYFGSPDYYLDIYLANRNKLRNPADTRAGISIRIPVYNSQ